VVPHINAYPQKYEYNEPAPAPTSLSADDPTRSLSALIDARIASMLGSRSMEIQALGRILAVCVGCADRKSGGPCRECPMRSGGTREGIFA
jgi:hypothetical protein